MPFVKKIAYEISSYVASEQTSLVSRSLISIPLLNCIEFYAVIFIRTSYLEGGRVICEAKIIGVCARVRGEGRELPGVGALAIYICHGSVLESGCLWGDSPGCGASLAPGTSCGKSSNSIL